MCRGERQRKLEKKSTEIICLFKILLYLHMYVCIYMHVCLYIWLGSCHGVVWLSGDKLKESVPAFHHFSFGV